MTWRAFLCLLLVAAAFGAAVGGLVRVAGDDAAPSLPTAAVSHAVGVEEAALPQEPALPDPAEPDTIVTPVAVIPTPPPPTFALTIRLRDDRSGEAARSGIRLWRLGLDADDEWTAGDRMVCQAEVPPEGADVGRFPAGRYRVQVLSACRDADDPPEIRLDGDAEHVLDARLPKTFPAHVVVFDETGRRIEEATLRDVGFACATYSDAGTPPWARPQNRREEEEGLFLGVGGAGVGCSAASGKSREIRAGPAGIPLGDMVEESRTRGGGRSVELSFPGRNAVHVRVVASNAGRGTYVAVAAPLDRVAAHVVLPDGMPAIAAGATVSAACKAEFVASEHPIAEGIDLPIEVTVRLEGFRTCRYDWRVGDPPAEPLQMEPIDSSAVPGGR